MAAASPVPLNLPCARGGVTGASHASAGDGGVVPVSADGQCPSPPCHCEHSDARATRDDPSSAVTVSLAWQSVPPPLPPLQGEVSPQATEGSAPHACPKEGRCTPHSFFSSCRKERTGRAGSRKAALRRRWREKQSRFFRSGRKTRGKAQARSVFRAPQGVKKRAPPTALWTIPSCATPTARGRCAPLRFSAPCLRVPGPPKPAPTARTGVCA